MQFLIAFTTIIALTSAGYIPDTSAIVQGPKATIAGPSGTIHADTGAVVRTADGLGGAIAPTVAYSTPLLHSGIHESPIISHAGVIAHEAPIISHAGVVDHSFGGSLLNTGLHGGGIYGSGFASPLGLYGSLNSGLYGNSGLSAGLYGSSGLSAGLYGSSGLSGGIYGYGSSGLNAGLYGGYGLNAGLYGANHAYGY